MKTRNALLTLALSPLCLLATSAGSVEMANHGVPNVPASRVVGLWTNQALVRPCDTTLPLRLVRNTMLFHAGGTAVANLDLPMAGIPNYAGIPGIHLRGPDLGTWSYNPLTHQYTTNLRFDWYVDGLYHGYSTVNRTFLLSNDARQASGPVRVTRYRTDGSVIDAVCGNVESTRV